MSVYKAIKNSDNNIINLKFLNCINNDNKEDKDILLLVNEMIIIYNIIFYKNDIKLNNKSQEISNKDENILNNLELSYKKRIK